MCAYSPSYLSILPLGNILKTNISYEYAPQLLGVYTELQYPGLCNHMLVRDDCSQLPVFTLFTECLVDIGETRKPGNNQKVKITP